MTTENMVSLGDAEDLWDGTWTGWSYPQFRTTQRLIGNGVDAGNLVVQEGSKGYREGALSFIAIDEDQKDLVRGYYEDGDGVEFVDFNGLICSVQVLEFASSQRVGDLWNVSVRLLQLSEPSLPGS